MSHEEKILKAMPAHDTFMSLELAELPRRNERLSGVHQVDAAEISRRQAARLDIVLTCMDERTALVEDALGFLPGQAAVFASGGARLDIADFKRLHGLVIEQSLSTARPMAIWLITHECAGESNFGCAAFQNDVPAQVAYFQQLKRDLQAAWPDAFVHVLLLDSTTYHFKDINVDKRDRYALEVLQSSGRIADFTAEEKAHAGYGIYVGDTYRAWVAEHNRYFRISSANPALTGNIGIALTVMIHHSTVDLSEKPIILQVDYPTNTSDDATLRTLIDRGVDAALSEPTASELVVSGLLKIVRTTTDARSWIGRMA